MYDLLYLHSVKTSSIREALSAGLITEWFFFKAAMIEAHISSEYVTR